MPLLSIATNIEISADAGQELITQASRLTAELLGKPESYVMVHLQDGQTMSFAGNTQPLAYCELKSIGLPVERSQEFSRSICEMLETQLSVPADRVYIEFSNAERNLWGWNAGTF